MNTAEVHYLGKTRSEATHLRSESKLITDAPIDNQGKGESFSPTDLVATGVLTCMVSLVGMQAEKQEWKIGKLKGEVKKIMAEHPRRIIQLEIHLSFKDNDLSGQQRMVLERTAIHCPAAMSLHPDITQLVRFSYD